MEYETLVLIKNNWKSCDTYFTNPTDAYNYLVRCSNDDTKVKGIKVINITNGETEVEEIL